MQLFLRDRDLDDGEVGALIDTFHLTGGHLPVAEGDTDLVGARYDARIGENVALVVDHDPGTLSLAERPRAGTTAGGIDRDYAVLGLLIAGGKRTVRRGRCRHPRNVGLRRG